MNGLEETDTLTLDSATLGSVQTAQPQLVVALERLRPLAGSARHSLANIDRVTIGRGAARGSRRSSTAGVRSLAITVPDPRMSCPHAAIERDDGAWRLVDLASTNGSRVGGATVKTAGLADGDLLELGSTFLRFRSAMRTPISATGDVDSATLTGLVASCGTLLPCLARDLEELGRLARSNASVLLVGESGTGKEVLARSIHEASGRAGPFVPVNCGAFPGGLVESLLFGHKKGAFSGATSDEPGFMRAAHGGTLFLDEVGDLAKPGQVALLRALQEHEVVPVGATRAVAADARVVAATHRSLDALVSAGEFRHDLLARIAAFTFVLPPLRERLDDLGVLLAATLRRAGGRASSLVIGADAARALLAHGWPDNVRELVHWIDVHAALAVDDRIEQARFARRPQPE